MDLNLMINDTLSQLKKEGYIEKIVKAQLQDTIKSVINDSLRSYSDFGKQLEKQVKEQLQINLDSLDIPSYNTLILATIRDHLDAAIHEEGVNRMKEQLDGILLTSKTEYKLSELIEQLSEEVEDLNELDYEEVHEMTLHIELENWSTRIYFDAESNKSKYDCKYHIWIDPETGEVNSIRIREDGYSTRGNKEFKEFDTKTIMGGFYGLERTLFKIYARKSKLVIDEKDCKLELTNPEYE